MTGERIENAEKRSARGRRAHFSHRLFSLSLGIN
jgi:hypothetical protein